MKKLNKFYNAVALVLSLLCIDVKAQVDAVDRKYQQLLNRLENADNNNLYPLIIKGGNDSFSLNLACLVGFQIHQKYKSEIRRGSQWSLKDEELQDRINFWSEALKKSIQENRSDDINLKLQRFDTEVKSYFAPATGGSGLAVQLPKVVAWNFACGGAIPR